MMKLHDAQLVELPTVELIGVKDGVETSIGQVPMPPTMKARELLRDVGFTGLDDDDGDGAYAMGACEQLIEYCQAYYSAPQADALDATRADARDTELLDFVEANTVALEKEWEGPWQALVYGESESPSIIEDGKTAREALRAAIAAQAAAAKEKT